MAARLALPFNSGWLALLASGLLAISLIIGFVANAAGNENLGNGLLFVAILVGVAWLPLSLLAIVISPRSMVARVGCLLPFFVYGVISLLSIYVFDQLG